MRIESGLRWLSVFCVFGAASACDDPEPVEVASSSSALRVSAGPVTADAGRGFACGLGSAGEAYCWGRNNFGQVGAGFQGVPEVPVPVRVGAALGAFTAISAGADHACGIAAGALYCWGGNARAQLGDGSTIHRATPVRIGTASDWTAVSAGVIHTCGLRGTALWCWGGNGSGQVGVGSLTEPRTPAPVAGTFASVTSGEAHTCAIESGSRNLYCFGNNSVGQLGLAGTQNRLTPALVSSDAFTVVDTGQGHTCAVRSDATLWCTGVNGQGRLGDGTGTTRFALTRAGTASDWASVATGVAHTCGLSTGGEIRCFGQGNQGQLGLGTLQNTARPTPVPADRPYTAITAGSGTCASDGASVVCFGSNRNGELGGGIASRRLRFEEAGRGHQATIAQAAFGRAHGCIVKVDGSLWCAGLNASGQLGIGNFVSRQAFTRVGAGTTWASVDTGDGHSCALRRDGALFCWGSNSGGQLGDGSTAQRTTPVQVAGTWSRFAVGFNHTCGVRDDGFTYCWGTGTNGRLGDGTTATTRLVPTRIASSANHVALALGDGHSCGLRSTGELDCWGYGGFGALGQNNTLNSLSPVVSATRMTAVAAGASSVCSIDLDGALWCWGLSHLGQAGTAAQTVLAPQIVAPGPARWTTIAARGFHTCGVRGGAMQCFGNNGSGQLGDGTYSRRNGPIAVGVASPASIALGFESSCALTAGRTLLCAGENGDGQLGDARAWAATARDGSCVGADHGCAPNAYCGDEAVAAACVCEPGLEGDGLLAGTGCTDVDECLTDNGGCAASAACTNLPGTRSCACPAGYNGDGFSCADIDECILANGGCAVDATCTNTEGSRSCACNAGYDGDGVTCLDVDECLTANGGCDANASCTNTIGARTCACAPGFEGDGESCADVDECATGLLACADHESCVNTVGSSECACAGPWGDCDGAAGNGCERSLTANSDCGGCGIACVGTDVCSGGSCVACIPSTCEQLGLTAGSAPDGCGGRVWCGDTPSRLASGTEHTCSLDAAGGVRCWGNDASLGRLGLGPLTGSQARQFAPSGSVIGLPPARSIVAGNGHTCALITDGSVQCWGENTFGQLGSGPLTFRSTPIAVPGVTAALDLVSGTNFTCAIVGPERRAQCWGTAPTSAGDLTQIVDLGAGDGFVCAVQIDGRILCLGNNAQGQLGNGGTTTAVTPTPVSNVTTAVAMAKGTIRGATCAVMADRSLRCWGANESGQTGVGSTGAARLTPVTVVGIGDAVEVTSYRAGACARSTTGGIRCWGDNSSGSIGDGSSIRRLAPTAAVGVAAAVELTSGDRHNCTRLADQTLRCWGANAFGQLGDESTFGRTAPVSVVDIPCGAPGTSNRCDATCEPTSCASLGLTSGTVGDGCGGTLQCGDDATGLISAGRLFQCARRANGTVACWGNNPVGQLGDGTRTARSSPVTVLGITDATFLAAGNDHACAIVGGGSVQCWGVNNWGQLGSVSNEGGDNISTVPLTVPGITTAVALAAGQQHTCARLANGTMRCWGESQYGALGDNRLDHPRFAGPIDVLGLTEVAGLGSGPRLSCAVLTFGGVACWGDGLGVGQLGMISGLGVESIPRRVPLIGNARAMAHGGGASATTCVVLTDGTARCWGSNNSGQIGDGTYTGRTEPVVVRNLTGIVEMTTGVRHTCARLTSGSVRCWGSGDSGQLGNGSDLTQPNPVTVSGLADAIAISGGEFHTCAYRSSGEVWCWGSGGFGQLGNGTFGNRSTIPVRATGF